ncbi:hypothetical protein ABBQ32_001771 [Trebouxia sp. C0010 RCD-2024]
MSSIDQDAASSSTQELNSTCAYLIYFESLEYLIPRLLVWLALFALATTDGVLHKHIKRRGWQLHRGICVVIGGFVLQDILLVTYSIGKRRGSTSAAIENVCKSYIFFADLADSLFIVMMMGIAAGYCITRDNLGPYKVKVLVIPTVYFVTTLVSDFISNTAYAANDSVNLVESLCLLTSLVALLLAWVYIFDTVQRERELLEGPKEGIIGAQGLQDPSEVAHTTTVFPPDRADSSKGKDGEAGGTSGQAVELPAQMLAEAAEGRRIGDLYAPMQDQDTDKHKTIEDQMQLRSKVRLMKQFQWGVAAYVIAKAAVIMVPALVWVEPGDAAFKTIYILQNSVRWLFLAALCWIFSSTAELHTELGLVQSDSQADLEAGRGNDSPVSIDRNFSIGDLEDEDDMPAKPVPSTAAAPPSPRRQNKSLMPNRQQSSHVEDGDMPSQSSSPKQSRPLPPPKPSGKKD